MQTGKILLVEDNDDDAELTTMAFRQAGVRNPMVRVRDGVEALDYLCARGAYLSRDPQDIPAVVLLDIQLPRKNGLQVLRELRQDGRVGHIPVVMLTSSDEASDRLDAYRHHANSYVRKPIDYDQFVQAAQEMGHYWLKRNLPAPPD